MHSPVAGESSGVCPACEAASQDRLDLAFTISILTGSGSALSIAGLLYAGATLALLGVGALGYGISIWLGLLALRDLGAAREAVLFSTAPFVGALFSVVVLLDSFSAPLLLAAGLMGAGVVLLLREQHSHRHRHETLLHAHRHRHDPRGGDPHHEHNHAPDDLQGLPSDRPFWPVCAYTHKS